MTRRVPGAGALIDRSLPVSVLVDGQEIEAFRGDTLASAMLAAGIRVASVGIYTGRPRGLVSIGSDEPNGFVQVLSGPGEGMVRCTELEVYEGLAVARLAGRGRLAESKDESRYDHQWVHAEFVVVGGGLAGLADARVAARTGARVVLMDDQPRLGGWLTGVPGTAVSELVAELTALPNVRILTRTTAVGLYDHGHVVAVERRTDHLPDAPEHVARRRLWHITGGEITVATGADERPMICPDNDRPGVMLSGAAAEYLRRYGVLPGEDAVVWTAHDGGLYDALALVEAGVNVKAVLDVRTVVGQRFVDAFEAVGLIVQTEAQIVGTDGDDNGLLSAVHVRAVDQEVEYKSDLLAISGGLNPVVHLYSQVGGRLVWSDVVAGFVPDHVDEGQPGRVKVIGSAAGRHDLSPDRPLQTPPATWFVGDIGDDRARRAFLDPHRDATLHDLRKAHSAGMTAVEHVKRYTTIGTGADQGRGFGVLAVGALASELGKPIGQVGTTTFRPPYTPVSFGLLAGRRIGPLCDPIRVTPMHDRHVAAGAVFENVGQWTRAWYFPAEGEDLNASVLREVRAVRSRVGMTDASSLGKIHCFGADVGELLDRIYTGVFSTLGVGKIRYGVMCRPDGMVFDDGTVARLTESDWLISTTTGNAAPVMDMLEEWLMTEWPSLDVQLTSVTEQWAVIVVAGPYARSVIASLSPSVGFSNADFGFMEWRATALAGLPARLMRISFSGELAYELHVPSWFGAALWDAVAAAGAQFGITTYGTEAVHVLRAEKGFAMIGQETDGTATPFDLGMAWAVSPRKIREGTDFLGARSFTRRDTARRGRRQMVGIVPVDGRSTLVEGAQIVAAGANLASLPVPMLGHITSAYTATTSGIPFGLAMIAGGRDRVGEVLDAVDNLTAVRVKVVDPVTYDPMGARRDG